MKVLETYPEVTKRDIEQALVAAIGQIGRAHV